MKSFKFDTAYDMASFINEELSVSPLRSEQLMSQGLQYKKVNGVYKITVNISEIK